MKCASDWSVIPFIVHLLSVTFTQGDSEEKVNILGVNSIGHCEGEKKVHISMSLNVNGYRDRAG